MTTMIAELYDALLAAGSPEDKARKAAEAMAGYDAYDSRLTSIETRLTTLERDVGELRRDVGDLKQRVTRVEGDLLLLKWMVGFVLAFQVAMFVKLFVQ
jgi:phage shock protein A